MSASCTSCHSAAGSQAGSPLTTYTEVKGQGAIVVSRVVAGTMPPGAGLSQKQKDLFTAWQKVSFPEKTGGTTTPTTTTPGGATGNGVEFRIKKGTGAGAWNTQATEVVAKVGQPFTIHNDDDQVHQWHTNGTPCDHGNEIQPGQSETCTPSAAYNDGPLYDHNTRGQFFIRAE